MKNIVYLNGKFLPQEEAKISVFSRGVLYAEGLFETMRAYQGRVFRLEEHLRRLKNGAKVLGLKVPKEIKKSEKIIQKLTEKNNFSDAYVRLNLVSFACHSQSFTCHSDPDESWGKNLAQDRLREESQLIFFCRNIKDYLKKKASWDCVIVKKIRQNEFSPLSRIKSLNYLPMLLARKEAESKGADEGILLNTKGEICEGTRTNIFVVTEDGILKTPAIECGCLPGITRKAVIELAKSIELRVEEKKLKTEDLKRAKEVFLTNSLIGVMPVVKIDQQIVSNGHPGPLTLKIREISVRYYVNLGLQCQKNCGNL